ncbi:MAG: type III-B CRISPR module RAMP protein Cmr6 [Vulcanimicrobiaceae bacterium]
MRRVLTELGVPEHLGLAYDAWAPTGDDGKVADAKSAAWLAKVAQLRISADYAHAFRRWKSNFSEKDARIFELTLASRLLVGHGNPSATDVGLTLHHTWGVPIIPGSALKGLCAHYVDAVYGPGDRSCAPWEQPELDRVPYQGVSWHGRRIQRGPGAIYRALFGAPDTKDDEMMRSHDFDSGAASGLVAFQDALYVAGSATDDRPFASDVLTVHQETYYRHLGATWPNDYDDPNPVAFLTVRPGVKMLFAICGAAEWTELAERLLKEALGEWGVGGKTSSGYGRFAERAELAAAIPTAARRYARGDCIKITPAADPSGKPGVKYRADDGLSAHFVAEAPPPVSIGEILEVWVANASDASYTVTLRLPKKKSK